jgi:hypothetical protein
MFVTLDIVTAVLFDFTQPKENLQSKRAGKIVPAPRRSCGTHLSVGIFFGFSPAVCLKKLGAAVSGRTLMSTVARLKGYVRLLAHFESLSLSFRVGKKPTSICARLNYLIRDIQCSECIQVEFADHFWFNMQGQRHIRTSFVMARQCFPRVWWVLYNSAVPARVIVVVISTANSGSSLSYVLKSTSMCCSVFRRPFFLDTGNMCSLCLQMTCHRNHRYCPLWRHG